MKPRVLQLVGSFAQGGSERQAVQVSRLLLESGRYEVYLACLDGRGVLRAEAEQIGFTSVPEFPLTSFYDANALRQIRRFSTFLRKKKIEVVQTYDFYTNVFGMAGAAIARVPVRIAARRETEGVRTAAQKWTERRAFALAHAIAVNSEAVRKELVNDGVNANKIVTIYNGMDTKRVAPRENVVRETVLAALGLPGNDQRRFVTIVANMRHPMKDQATFLRAAQLVRAAVPDSAFILAGEGELLAQTRALAAELRLEGATIFPGHCGKVAELLSISDVGVLSSRGVEGFSNSIIEYMAAARPVVATDVGGAREAVVDGDSGYIVPPGDFKIMADKIISLLNDPLRARQMGDAGLRIVMEKFSCEAQLKGIENLYAKLLAGASASQPLIPVEGNGLGAPVDQREVRTKP